VSDRIKWSGEHPFCVPHESHFCPCVRPELYDRTRKTDRDYVAGWAAIAPIVPITEADRKPMTEFHFAVYNLDADAPFKPFLIDAQALDEDEAARRAWAAAVASLATKGIAADRVQVCCWRDGKPGPAVTADGVWK